jgi:alpha-beta hydrolase superfamily lysophospholipase
VKQTAFLFGETQALMGILAWPAEPRRDLAVILLNSGVLHRMGPNRLYVKIASRLSARGLAVFRFDLSGIGDSEARRDGLRYAESTLQETRAAMDVVEKECGIRRFVLMGICSGADNALRIAPQDPRIVGIVPIEGLTFQTKGYALDRLRRRILVPRTWKKLVTGRLDPLASLRSVTRHFKREPPGEAPTEGTVWTLPRAADVAQDLAAFTGRGGRANLIYSTLEPGWYHYRAGLKKLLAPLVASGKITVTIADGTDHLFTPLEQQTWLLGQLEEWTRGLVEGEGAPQGA